VELRGNEKGREAEKRKGTLGHPWCGLLMRTSVAHSSFVPDTLTHFCLSAGMEQDAQPAKHLPRDSRCLLASETSALAS